MCRLFKNQAKLETEKRNSAVNALKVNEGWRSILRQTQDPKLRQHITMLKQQFEREVDGLDGSIKVKPRSSHSCALTCLTLSVSLPVCLGCRIWSVACCKVSVSRLRCAVLTCRTWRVCVRCRKNG